MPSFGDVVQSWRDADPSHIHPLRNVSEDAYWESGRAQALHAAAWIPENGRVLDFGCGDGRLSIPLSKLGFYVIAADASSEMLERLDGRPNKVKLTLHTDGSDFHLFKAAWPVDTVVCRAVLIHHSHADVAKLVGAFSSVLKPGGHLIADWPVGPHYVRQNWCDVTTWEPKHRQEVAAAAGLELVSIEPDQPSVWAKL